MRPWEHPTIAEVDAQDAELARALAMTAHPLGATGGDWDPLLERIGDARLVLLGESTHGTHEMYRARAQITQRLIAEKGFHGLAVEADWPDAYRVNRFVRGEGADGTPEDALAEFRRFPQWMWRNADVVELVRWLRDHDAATADPARRAGFYGLDLYSLHASMSAVLSYLDAHDPVAAREARRRYACFEGYRDPQVYGHAAAWDVDRACVDQVVAQLVELGRGRDRLVARGGMAGEDAYFWAEQNARLVKNAEAYYRSMFQGRVSSWNVRDRHMVESLEQLLDHLDRRLGTRAKLVVWAHNSHLGDARATEMGRHGEVNLGQLARELHGRDCVNVGFTTWAGSVAAADDWDLPVKRMSVRPALPGSYEALFHQVGVPRFLLDLGALGEAGGALRRPRLQRAIGVIYRPISERASHYLVADLVRQFDAVVHLDVTSAVAPLERDPAWTFAAVDEDETYPFGL